MKNKLFLIVAFILSAVMHAQSGPAVISASGPSIVITAPRVEVNLPQVKVITTETRTCKHSECRKSHHCCKHNDNGKHKGHHKHKQDYSCDNRKKHHSHE